MTPVMCDDVRMSPDDSRDDLKSQLHDFEERIETAAIEAEFQTGRREESVEEAKRHVLFRLARMAAGFLLLILGIAAIPLPGPGWALVAAALVILAQDFVWAERTLRFIRKQVPGVPEEGVIPRNTWYVMGGATTVTIGFTIWWYFIR